MENPGDTSDKSVTSDTRSFEVYLVDASESVFSLTSEEINKIGERDKYKAAVSCLAKNLSEIRSYTESVKQKLDDSVLVFTFGETDCDRPKARFLEGVDRIETFMTETANKYCILSDSWEKSLNMALRAAQAIVCTRGSLLDSFSSQRVPKRADKSIYHFTTGDNPFEDIKGVAKTAMGRATLQLSKDAQKQPEVFVENWSFGWLDLECNVLILYADLIGLEGGGRAQFMPTSGEKLPHKSPNQIPSPNCNPAGLQTQSMCSSKEGQFCREHAPRYLNDFEEVKLLGEGGFGGVFLCKNKLDGRQYAMKKILLPKGLPVNDRMLREVLTLSRLQHEHVVRYYQAFTGSEEESGKAHSGSDSLEEEVDSVFKQYLYIQMEYCPRTLSKVLLTAPVDEELMWKWLHQLSNGLAYVHSQGIMHRDLNPLNIFLDSNDDVKIGDFGLAKFLKDDSVFEEGSGMVGNELYMAPEIANEETYMDEKVDMYNLGIILFEMCHFFPTQKQRHDVSEEGNDRDGMGCTREGTNGEGIDVYSSIRPSFCK